jgi:hypothetical protein
MQVGVVDRHNLDKKDSDTGSRFQRAAAHAVNHLRWKMQLREEYARGNRHAHLNCSLVIQPASWWVLML